MGSAPPPLGSHRACWVRAHSLPLIGLAVKQVSGPRLPGPFAQLSKQAWQAFGKLAACPPVREGGTLHTGGTFLR